MAVRKEQEPHPIDAHVGGRLRLRRLELRMSQSTLAEKLGISFQAVQKYELGVVRLSASRLYDAALALAVRPSFFFDGIAAAPEWEAGDEPDPREVATLLRGYHGIRDRRLQAELRRFVATLATGAGE